MNIIKKQKRRKRMQNSIPFLIFINNLIIVNSNLIK